MKRIIQKSLIIFILTLLVCTHICYADALGVYHPEKELLSNTKVYSVIGGIILLISVVSYILLKRTANKTQPSSDDNKEATSITNKLEARKHFVALLFLLFFSILAALIHRYTTLTFKSNFWKTDLGFSTMIILYFIPILLFVISIICKISKKHPTLRRITFFYGILIVITTLIVTKYIHRVERLKVNQYNSQFLQFQIVKPYDLYYGDRPIGYTSNITELINSVIDNNSTNTRQTAIFYKRIDSSPEELNKLLTELNTDLIYDTDNLTKDGGYIDTIKIIPSIDRYSSLLHTDLGARVYDGDVIINIVNDAISKHRNKPYNSFNTTIVYTSLTGSSKTLDLNNITTQDEIENFNAIFDEEKNYTVESQSNNIDTVNMLITENSD